MLLSIHKRKLLDSSHLSRVCRRNSAKHSKFFVRMFVIESSIESKHDFYSKLSTIRYNFVKDGLISFDKDIKKAFF